MVLDDFLHGFWVCSIELEPWYLKLRTIAEDQSQAESLDIARKRLKLHPVDDRVAQLVDLAHDWLL